jgi:hypothetical protein
MIISYIEDKKKKRGHALPIGLMDRRINNAAVIGKVDIELREVREWCCVRKRDFFLLRFRLCWGVEGFA